MFLKRTEVQQILQILLVNEKELFFFLKGLKNQINVLLTLMNCFTRCVTVLAPHISKSTCKPIKDTACKMPQYFYVSTFLFNVHPLFDIPSKSGDILYGLSLWDHFRNLLLNTSLKILDNFLI